jgi:mono/diheme cytochrome c family protein
MNTDNKTVTIALLGVLVLFAVGASTVAAVTKGSRTSTTAQQKKIERGRYLIMIAACNDCHTPNFLETDGDVPESEWLTGIDIGFRGPWGVTYPKNLRHSVNSMSEKDWVDYVRKAKLAPPMPWWSLHNMTRSDVASIYAYIRSLGLKGELAPQPLPPGENPTTPVYDFVPVAP